jgi:hypothetical protein
MELGGEEQSGLAPVQEREVAWAEDQPVPRTNAFNAPGFIFPGEGTVFVFVCRNCPDWPVSRVEQT